MSKKEEYKKYLDSDKWKKLRKKSYKRANNKCELCGSNAECVHHISYPKHFSEDKLKNLLVCCHPCHEKQHGIFDGGTALLKRTIAKRINYIENEEPPFTYNGFDMSLTHGGNKIRDLESERERHFNFFMDNFKDYMSNNFTVEQFNLWFWKGTGWWGDINFNYNDKEFGGESSLEIIFWIIRNHGRFSKKENQEWFIRAKEEYEKQKNNLENEVENGVSI